MVGMGTFCCIAPVFAERPAAGGMMPYGLNTEHAAPKGQYISFIFNHAGSILKWYRDTFAPEEARLARVEGRDIYPDLLSEIPLAPSSVMVLPHFAPTGPPEFIEDSSGVIMGLKLETRRGDILKGILEGVVFYLREALEPALAAGIPVDEFRAVGGGSRSPEWLQIYADILGRPLRKMVCEEAGTLGSAIIAGAATGVFASIQEGADATVRFANVVEPAPARVADYDRNFARYRNMWPMMQDIIRQK
jgi:xylulokinase